jgi:hypothetical protein
MQPGQGVALTYGPRWRPVDAPSGAIPCVACEPARPRLASFARMFFTSSEELSQTRFVPLVIDATVDLGGAPSRPEIIDRAIELGRFSNEELAVPSHTKQDRESGRGAVEGRLRYAIWQARTSGFLLSGKTDGRQVLTDKGRALIGAPTGYPELDARRRLPAQGSPANLASTLRPYVPPRRDAAERASLVAALPRSGYYDMDALDRRTADHHALQSAAERWLTSLGWTSHHSPIGSQVLADLMGEHRGRWVVVEVKTIDPDRPELARQQLRLGLGQVLDYRQRLRRIHADTHGVIVVSIAPSDPAWIEITNASDIGLTWPPFDLLPAQLTPDR